MAKAKTPTTKNKAEPKTKKTSLPKAKAGLPTTKAAPKAKAVPKPKAAPETKAAQKAKIAPPKAKPVAQKPTASKKGETPQKAKGTKLPKAPPKRKTVEVTPKERPLRPRRAHDPAAPEVIAAPPAHTELHDAHHAVAREALYHLSQTEPSGKQPTADEMHTFAARLFLTAEEIAAFLAAPNVRPSELEKEIKVDLLAVARAYPSAVVDALSSPACPVKPRSFPASKVASAAENVVAAASIASKLRAAAAYIEHSVHRDAVALDKAARELAKDASGDDVRALFASVLAYAAATKR